MNKLNYDIVIIGGGGTGLTAALNCDKNLKICILSKVHPLRSQTCMAQGGMNAAVDGSIQAHIDDTIRGGDDLSDEISVKYFCEKAPEAIEDLEKMGMIFSRTEKGKIAQRPFGGNSEVRTCYSRDYTGHNLITTLYTQCLKNEIEFLNEWFATELVVDDGKISGLNAYDISTGELHTISAKSIIIATGGAGQIYKNTVNATISTGDGMALAYRTGCALKDIEFVQFHPTTLHHRPLLISEGTRGEGAHLINKNEERFVDELAERDVVARAIQKEINEGRDFNGAVHLDLKHLDKEVVLGKLSQIHKIAKEFGNLDCLKEPIPVKPGAHYFMGGISTNEECETEIKGLFAAGECACAGIHGANRLGGNSLMETVVFGKKAGINASKFASNKSETLINKSNTTKEQKNGNEDQYKIKHELKDIMLKNAGIFRNEESLQQALDKVNILIEKSQNLKKSEPSPFNYEFYDSLELKNMLDIAKAILKSALKRRESRGAHFRTDFPERDDQNFKEHSLIYYGKN